MEIRFRKMIILEPKLALKIYVRMTMHVTTVKKESVIILKAALKYQMAATFQMAWFTLLQMG